MCIRDRAASVLLAGGGMTAGQPMTGTYSAAPPGDTITSRYATNSGDGILNCTGTSNTSGAVAAYVNTFSVVNSQLVCTLNGTQYPLVSGVTNLDVYKRQEIMGVQRIGIVEGRVDGLCGRYG